MTGRELSAVRYQRGNAFIKVVHARHHQRALTLKGRSAVLAPGED